MRLQLLKERNHEATTLYEMGSYARLQNRMPHDLAKPRLAARGWHRIHRISALASAGANRSANLAKCAVHQSLTSLHGSSKSRCEYKCTFTENFSVLCPGNM